MKRCPVFPTSHRVYRVLHAVCALKLDGYRAGAVEVMAVLLNTAIQVFKVLLQPDNLVFNLSAGALHHVDGECVVIQIIQNCAIVGKTHSGLTAGSNKPYRGDEFLVKSASSKKRRALTLYEHPASHNPTVKVNVNSQRAERQLRIPSHSLTIPHPLFGENNIQRDARNAPGCRLP